MQGKHSTHCTFAMAPNCILRNGYKVAFMVSFYHNKISNLVYKKMEETQSQFWKTRLLQFVVEQDDFLRGDFWL